MLPGMSNVFALVKARRKLIAVMVVGDGCIGLKHRFQPRPGVASLVPDRDEMLEVAGNLAFMPGG